MTVESKPLSALIKICGGRKVFHAESGISIANVDNFIKRNYVTRAFYPDVIKHIESKDVLLDEKQKDAILTGNWIGVSTHFIKKDGGGNESQAR